MKKIKMSNYSILSILTVLLIGLLPFNVKADTADVDTHFDVRVVETADSKKGAEAVEVTVKNITNQTGKNVKATVELPKAFADKLKTEAVTRTLGTLEAGESKSFIIKLSDSSTTTLPTTSTSKRLPTTGDKIVKGAVIVGVMLLIIAGFILRKRKLLGLLVALLALTGAALASASTYNHKATHHHQVKVVGQVLPFTTVVTGDFEEEASSSNTDNSSSPSTDNSSSPSTDNSSSPSTDNSSSTNNSSSSSQSSTASSDSDNPETPEEPVTPEVIKYTVSFDLNGGDSEAIPSQEVEANGTASVPKEPAKTGYRFDGWYEKEADELKANAWNFTTDKVTKATELYAKWAAKTDTVYTVEHYKVSSDGTAVLSETEDLTGTTDTMATAIAKTYVGYTYQASYDQGGNQTVASGNIASDGTLVLKLYYTANSYTINYLGGEGVTGSTASSTHYYDEAKALTSNGFSKAGYVFSGWQDSNEIGYTDGQSVTNLATSGTVTLTAQWVRVYSVTYDFNSGTTYGDTVLPTDSNSYQSGATVATQNFDNNFSGTATETKYKTKKRVTKFGYHFRGWNTQADGQGTSVAFNGSFTMPAADITLFAQWTRNPGENISFDISEEEDYRVLRNIEDQRLLVLKALALTEVEATGSGNENVFYKCYFRDQTSLENFISMLTVKMVILFLPLKQESITIIITVLKKIQKIIFCQLI